MFALLQRLERRLPAHRVAQVKRYWLSLSFLFGFIVDSITLNNVEQLFDNIVLLTYVLLSMTGIVVMYAAIAGRFREKWTPFLRTYSPLFVQFAFGGLLSGMLVFYGRSSAWAESWPLLLLIVGVILGNEFITKRAQRFYFNLTILFVGLFLYLVLIIPVLTGMMGPWVFIASSVVAATLMYGFVRVLRLVIPRFVALQYRGVLFLIGVIVVGFNTLYFTNIIPPIPLSLKEAGIYHSVVRFDDGTYQLRYEAGRWWQPFKNSDTVLSTKDAAQNVYCYAAVFAPTRLRTEIVHQWEYFDSGRWREHARISYPIYGGRAQGYRGYSLISPPREGRWRCSVETARGQLLGREYFTIDATHQVGELVTREIE